MLRRETHVPPAFRSIFGQWNGGLFLALFTTGIKKVTLACWRADRSGRKGRGRSGGGQENTRAVENLTYQFLAGSRLDTFSLTGVFQLLEFLQPFDPAQPIGSLPLLGGDLKLRLSASHFTVGHFTR